MKRAMPSLALIWGRLLFVLHIEFEDTFIRIISARRAEPEEEQKYAF